jgi:putative phosphoribosyl transferase
MALDMDEEAPIFRDRHQAGRILARRLASYANRSDVTVLGLPRGGVPVAYEVARALDAPLGCFVVRKLGAPGHPELAMGAVATGGTIVVNDETVEALGIPDELIQREAAEELQEIARQEQLYGAEVPPVSIAGRTVILVDDGLATGATMRAAVSALRKLDPARIVAATPVASNEACSELRLHADESVCVSTPEPFYAVGAWYRDFTPTTDEEVTTWLDRFGDGGKHVGKSARGGSAS